MMIVLVCYFRLNQPNMCLDCWGATHPWPLDCLCLVATHLVAKWTPHRLKGYHPLHVVMDTGWVWIRQWILARERDRRHVVFLSANFWKPTDITFWDAGPGSYKEYLAGIIAISYFVQTPVENTSGYSVRVSIEHFNYSKIFFYMVHKTYNNHVTSVH